MGKGNVLKAKGSLKEENGISWSDQAGASSTEQIDAQGGRSHWNEALPTTQLSDWPGSNPNTKLFSTKKTRDLQ